MKLRDYLKAISDDEGNSFHLVHFEPCIGQFDENDREFETQIRDGANAVCLN